MLTINRQQVYEEARKWIGTRWVHLGRDEHGVDCAGMVLKVGEALGFPVEDMQNYRRSPDGIMFREHIVKQTTFQAQPTPGSIGLFREAKFPTHTGIFGVDNYGRITLIHAYMPYRKVMEEPFINDWPKKLVAVRNFPGLID